MGTWTHMHISPYICIIKHKINKNTQFLWRFPPLSFFLSFLLSLFLSLLFFSKLKPQKSRLNFSCVQECDIFVILVIKDTKIRQLSTSIRQFSVLFYFYFWWVYTKILTMPTMYIKGCECWPGHRSAHTHTPLRICSEPSKRVVTKELGKTKQEKL